MNDDARTGGRPDFGFAEDRSARVGSQNPAPPGLKQPEDGSFGSGVDQPLQLLVQGMRQLQQVYLGRSEGDVKANVEIPAMPEVGPDSAVEFADWLYETEQAVGALSDKATLWFFACLGVARDTYQQYVDATPLRRLTLEPTVPAELKQPQWFHLERRVTTHHEEDREG